jgi:rhamnose transport system ATP-binding protein
VSLLRASQLTKSFGAVRALRGVSFELEAGEVHALLGENGAGKSTLIKVIAGAHAPDSGELEVGCVRVEHFSPREAHRHGISCIYQQPALFPDLTVAENIALAWRTPAPGISFDAARNANARPSCCSGSARTVDPDREIRELSMPEQQLVEIACAIGTGARIVIMDEPTASLTQKEQHLLFSVVRELRTNGVGVIYISHRLEEIFALGRSRHCPA